MTDTGLDLLAADLTHLGRSLPEPTVDPALTDAVMARLAAGTVAGADAPATSRRRLRTARPARLVAAAVAAVLVGALAAPPVRAAVVDFFGFAGVLVRDEPGAGPAKAGPPPEAADDLSLHEAVALVRFTPAVPAELGRPEGVEVSTDRRVLSMTWGTGPGTIRLDQFDGIPDYAVVKKAADVEFTTVAGDFAMWFDRPHEVVWLQRDGTPRRSSARLAGHTLIWQRGNVTMRLEGDLTRERARTIATSSRPLGNR